MATRTSLRTASMKSPLAALWQASAPTWPPPAWKSARATPVRASARAPTRHRRPKLHAWHDYYTDHGGDEGHPEIEEEVDLPADGKVVSSWGPYTSIVGTAVNTGVSGLTKPAELTKELQHRRRACGIHCRGLECLPVCCVR